MYARIDLKNMLRRQMVLPLNLNRLPAKSLDGWTGILPLIAPQSRGRKLRMQLSCEFQNTNAILIPSFARALRRQSLGNRQRVDISFQRARLAIDRLGNRLARLIIGIDALRTNHRGYRCNAQF